MKPDKTRFSADRVRMFGVPYTTANGQEFTLLWTNRGVAMAEDLGMYNPACGPNKMLQLALWACLIPLQPDTTPDDAADMIDIECAAQRAEALGEAIKLCREKAEGKQVPQQPVMATASNVQAIA